jgi:hypothetical protein
MTIKAKRTGYIILSVFNTIEINKMISLNKFLKKEYSKCKILVSPNKVSERPK